MAELAVGIIGLAALFNNSIECFQYIQIGRNYGNNFASHLIKLSNAELRLSRWGHAVGLGGDIGTRKDLDMAMLEKVFTKDNIEAAEMRLEQINELIDQAHAKSKGAVAAEAQGSSDEDNKSVKLAEQLQKLAVSRKNKMKSKRASVKWALGGSVVFKELVENISSQVKELEELFPMSSQTRQSLALKEVEEVGTTETAPLLTESASSKEVNDTDLMKALAELFGARSGSITYNIHQTGDALGGFIVGHHNGGIMTINNGSISKGLQR